MPDGQAESLASFLSAFPGFADEGSFQLKIDEAIDSLLEDVSDGTVTMSDLAFVTGELGLAITSLSPEVLESDEPPMVIGVGISDRAAADTFMSGMLEGVAPDVYGSANVYAADDATVAVADEWVLISPQADEIHAAIDVLDGSEPSLAEDPGFSAAFSRVPTAHLGAVYLDLQSLGALIEMGMAEGMTTFGEPMDVESILAMLPEDMVAYLAAAPDRLTLEAFITASEMSSNLPVGESDLADLFPGDTQLYVETRELGSAARRCPGHGPRRHG